MAGTLYVVEPQVEPAAETDLAMEGHALDPAKVMHLAAALGARPRRVLLVGCEPTPLADENDMSMGLSPAVEAALDEAVALVEGLMWESLQRAALAPEQACTSSPSP